MNRPSDTPDPEAGQWEKLRERIIGLGEKSIRKSHYPQLQQQLKELAQFRLFMDQVNDLILIFNAATGRLIDANQTALRVLSHPQDRLRELSVMDICPALSGGPFPFESAAAGSGPESRRIIILDFKPAAGPPVPVEASLQLHPLGNTRCGVIVARGIRERLAADRALRESERKYRDLIETTGTVFFIMDEHGRVQDANTEYLRLSGQKSFAAIRGQSMIAWTVGQDRQRAAAEIESCLKNGQIRNLEIAYRQDAGNPIPVEINANVVSEAGAPRIYALCRDISERRRQEIERRRTAERLQEAQKFESIGTLASGIAHDFNNVLMGIQGRTSMMLMQGSRTVMDREHLTEIESCIKSASDLTRQLLGFAGGHKSEPRPLDINQLLHDTIRMFGRTKKEIHIREDLDSTSGSILADANQMEQVFLNLLVNAWQAMPDGGTIFVQTTPMTLDASHTQPFGHKPGAFIRIDVTDTGIGMDEATRRRIFEPFFTTRAKGRGSGLGLATVYGIVNRHGGIIAVYSEPGRGSTFSVYLPVCDAPARPAQEPEKSLMRGNECILLVDDEEIILSVTQEMLSHLGYEVITASRGAAGLEIFVREHARIALVILDMIMPQMDGRAVFNGLRAVDPNVRVLVSSGYAINDQTNAMLKQGCRGFIQKPFTIQVLSKKIREILGADRQTC